MAIRTHVSIFLLLLLLFLFVSSAFAAAAVYKPPDAILLNCGSFDDSVDSDGRKWLRDNGDKIRISTGNSSPVKAGFQDPSLPSTVPYMAARVFSSVSMYQFPITSKARHYLRLHFYPSSYNSFLPEDALFSVSIPGGFTLLRNFSAYVTAQALTQAYIVKEFTLPAITDEAIKITFTPAPERKGSYAFINGIEVISIPDEIYKSPAAFIGGQTQEVGGSALQTMYRINVGGQFVPPANDSGLGRTWYDDSLYIYGSGFGVTFSAQENVTVEYPADYPEYIAPLSVYNTARSMGPTAKINLNYNLTWIFAVDANFTYIARLHFCELVMTKINQRVFDIYINNQTAQAAADVIGWTSSQAVPMYRDYAVFVAAGEEELWVALHPSQDSKPEYYDAILNGLEVFKLNDTSGNLAGPNPTLSKMMAEVEPEIPKFAPPKSDMSAMVVANVVGGAAALGLLLGIGFALYRRKKREQRRQSKFDGSDEGNSGWLPIYSSTAGGSKSTISGKSTTSSHLSSLAASLCRHFSIYEIKQATKNFDESLVIGVGGFGKVYKGVIDKTTKVAIKRSNPSSEQGVNEFQTEIEMLSKLRHRHLVSLIGYCEEGGEMILVYDYMGNGTLREHLYKTKNTPLRWKQRLEISIGSARGLHYLHTGAKYTIIHRDVKTTNILLDDKWVAKVSDFGLSKTGPTMNQGHVSTVVKGSFGYLDPEYFRRQQLTEKSDVYSFGVVLFEVLCGRPALNPTLPKEQVSLADWALICQRKGLLGDILDPVIREQIGPECLNKFADTAEKCLLDRGCDRPSMGDVLWNLEFALQLQESWEAGGGEIMLAAPLPQPPPPPPRLPDDFVNVSLDGGGNTEISDQSDGFNSTGVFSQLINPKGR